MLSYLSIIITGNAEKLAGRVKRDPGMVTRGEERKVGSLLPRDIHLSSTFALEQTGGDPTGTTWNDYPQNQ